MCNIYKRLSADCALTAIIEFIAMINAIQKAETLRKYILSIASFGGGGPLSWDQ